MSLDVPTEWIAFPLLASIGSVWGGWVQLKEGFREPVNLWFCGLGSPSSAKSPSLRSALEPIQRIDSELHAKREEAQKEFVRGLDRFISRKKGEFAQRPERVLIPQILVSNATTESLVPVCQANPRIPLLYGDELSGLFASFNQYRGGRGSDCEFFLSAFSGASHSVNRMGRDPVHLKSLRLSICGFSTPGAFKAGLGEGAASLVQRGFLGRFILSMPPNRVRKFSEEPIQSALVDKVERLLRDIWCGPSGVLEVAPQAKKVWVEFFDRTQRKSVSASEALGFHYGKLSGIVLRISGILCVARGGSKVTEEDMACALKIGSWIENETIRAYALLGVCRPPIDSVLMEFLITHPGASVRDISRIGPRALRKSGSNEIETRLRGLKGSGLVRSEFPSGAGRPGERWYVADTEEPVELPEPGDDGLDTDDFEEAFESLLGLAPPSDGLPELAAEEVLDSEAIASLRRRFTGSSI